MLQIKKVENFKFFLTWVENCKYSRIMFYNIDK